MAKVLVTGGCGYIGSHTIVDLLEHGYEVVSIDNFSNSTAHVLKGIAEITGVQVKNYKIDLCDLEATFKVFETEKHIDAVIHFAAFKAVGESIVEPWKYYHNNLNAQLSILECISRFDVGTFVFSSSCAVYGDTDELPVTEETPWREATSPYGMTKQIGERMSNDILLGHPCKRVYLRYFNPVGAHPSSKIGEAPGVAFNLVPIITQTAVGLREKFTVFGTDYPTPDGSCIRDYIHVVDVARAHTLAMEFIGKERRSADTAEVFNLGIGRGISVLELIEAFERETGQKVNFVTGPRRPGDVAEIFADASKARTVLGWKPEYTLPDMMRTAWQWEQRRSV